MRQISEQIWNREVTVQRYCVEEPVTWMVETAAQDAGVDVGIDLETGEFVPVFWLVEGRPADLNREDVYRYVLNWAVDLGECQVLSLSEIER